MDDLPIGAAVKAVRMSRNLSQRQLSALMECPRTWISKIENGVSEPRLDTLVRLGEAMDIEAWRILRYAMKLQRKYVAGEVVKSDG